MSKALISSSNQQIQATEAEVFKGDKPWDMNPLIFYRIKSPASGLENLPVLDPYDHFEQAEGNEQI